MRTWVSGASGFVGARLCARLRAAGHDVIGVDREVDVRDAARVAESLAAARPDALVHLAAVSSSAAAREEPARAASVNYLGARNVLEAMARHAPSARLLLVGSGEVYGASEPGAPPFTERDPLAPRTDYARTKACADLLGAACAARGLDVVRVRPFNHTGPGQPPDFVAPAFAGQIARIARGDGEPVLRVGNLDSVRDFLDVEDVIDAYEALLRSSAPAGVYNVASGVGVRIGALLDALREASGAAFRVEVDPRRWRETDCVVGDARRLREATGWSPRTPFPLTLERLLAAA